MPRETWYDGNTGPHGLESKIRKDSTESSWIYYAVLAPLEMDGTCTRSSVGRASDL